MLRVYDRYRFFDENGAEQKDWLIASWPRGNPGILDYPTRWGKSIHAVGRYPGKSHVLPRDRAQRIANKVRKGYKPNGFVILDDDGARYSQQLFDSAREAQDFVNQYNGYNKCQSKEVPMEMPPRIYWEMTTTSTQSSDVQDVWLTMIRAEWAASQAKVPKFFPEWTETLDTMAQSLNVAGSIDKTTPTAVCDLMRLMTLKRFIANKGLTDITLTWVNEDQVNENNFEWRILAEMGFDHQDSQSPYTRLARDLGLLMGQIDRSLIMDDDFSL